MDKRTGGGRRLRSNTPTKLTPEQQSILIKIRDEWASVSQTPRDFTEDEVEEGIEDIYALVGMGKPKIIICDDPLQCQYTANLIMAGKKYTGDPDQLKGLSLQFFSRLGGLSWRAWYLAKFDFCCIKTSILKVDEKTLKLLKSQINLLKKGIWDMITFDNVCILSKCPATLRDDEGKLHSVTKKAACFKSGYGFYSIHGVMFEEQLWKSVSQRTLSAKQVLEIKNMEQRHAAIRHYGMENIFNELDHTLIDRSPRGNELYSIRGIHPDKALLFVKYNDTSPTGRVFVKCVPDTDDQGNEIRTGDHAQAWSHRMTEEEYSLMDVES